MYIDDLLADRRPKPFEPDDFEAAQIRTAIDLQAARPGADQPRPEFLDSLKERIAAQMSEEDDDSASTGKYTGPNRPRNSPTRRQVIVGTTAAATAAVAAVTVDRMLRDTSHTTKDQQASSNSELVPNDGQWRLVAHSAELPEGAVRAFDLGVVNGFVRRVDGQVQAVSGVCTHQGCRLWLDQAAAQLRCPCHVTSFSPAGQVLTHQLPIAPKPLPHFEVREHVGVIEVLAPPAQPA
jgi:Rieske Fe-S protein